MSWSEVGDEMPAECDLQCTRHPGKEYRGLIGSGGKYACPSGSLTGVF